MKKIFKQSFSLVLALVMVLALIPVMPLSAKAEDFTPGETWTIGDSYKSLIQGAFTPAGDDFIYEADEAFNWKSWIVTAQNVSGLQSKAILSYNGQSVTKTASGINASKGVNLQLWTPASFPEITAEMYGNFTLTVEVYYGGNLIATGVLNFVRNAPAPVETEPVETEPVETEPVETEPVEITYGATFTPASGYEDKLNASFNTAEEDYIYEGTEAYDWNVTITNTYTKDIGVKVYATITTDKGQAVNKSKEMTLAVGENAAVDYTNFPELGTDVYGNFELKVTITSMVNGAEKAVGQLIAVFGRTEATEPEVPAAPTKPGEVLWQYASSAEGVSYDWLTGAIATETAGGIYKGWDAYDWKVTLSPTKGAAEVVVEATLEDHTGAVISTYTSEAIAVSKAPSVTTILTAGNFAELSNKMLGDFRVTAVIKYTNPETQETSSIAQVQFVFGRRIGDAGYTAVEYLPSYDWINGSFSAADDDMTYVGIQKYDWRATIAPSKSEATVDVAVTVVNAQGETVATLNKTGVVCGKGATTALVTAGEIAELTADLYGKFAITTVASMGGKEYAGIYGVIEHVEGEFVADTVAPEFGPANWENCGLPTAVTVTNNGEMNKPIEVTISITDAQGNVLASMNKTATVGAGASGELVTTNQLRGFIKERGATYYVVIEGRWSNGYDEYTINETLTYVWTEHDEAKAEVVPGFAATCTETGLTDGVFCHGCEGTITEQEEIPVDPEAHNYVDGTCACGATDALFDANLVVYKSNDSGGDLRLNNDIRAQFMVRLSNLKDYERIYLEIVHKGVTTPVEKDASSTTSLNRYFFVVPAAEMTMDMLVTVCGVKDGVTYHGDTLTFSVSNCINVKMAAWKDDPAQANMMKLAMALLNYGEKAQINFGINTGKLATAGLTQEYLDLIPAENPALAEWPTDGAAGQVTIYNHGLILKEKVNVVLVLKNTAKFDANASVEIIHHRSKEGDTVTYTYNSSNATISGTNARIVLDKLAPAQLRDTIEIVVKDGSGNAISATYQRSVPMIMNQSNYLQGDAKQVDLVYAIMKYADAAKLAFG